MNKKVKVKANLIHQ